MKKTNIYSLLSVSMFLLVILMGSCKKDYVNGGTTTQNLAGEWWVQIKGSSNYYSINTYNTAANNDSLWIDDSGLTFGIKGKVLANISAKTFSAANIVNQDSDGGYNTPNVFTITDGKVITNGAKASGTGDKTDSIHFVITYKLTDTTVTPSVVSTYTYTVGGYKRTGFSQDDH